MRTINPPKRFVNFPVFSSGFGGPATANLLAEFKFDTDSILHSCNMQVQFSIPPAAGAVFASLAVALIDLSGFDINSGINSSLLYAKASNGGLTGPPATQQLIPFTQRVHIDMLVRAGTTLSIVAQDNAVAVVQIDGGVSFSFTPLSEWVNFREPGTTVRL